MKYELLFLHEVDYGEKKGNIALILRGEKIGKRDREYAVVRNLDLNEPMESDCQWDNTISYHYPTIQGLQAAIEVFRDKTESTYIPRCRLEELATQFKDGLMEDDEEQARIYFDETCDMTHYEKQFFGIEDIKLGCKYFDRRINECEKGLDTDNCDNCIKFRTF